jgi:nucleoside-diphosphate-sugar epimerase
MLFDLEVEVSLTAPFPTIQSEADLEERLSQPTPEVIEALAALDGDIILLGVGGKMGPTLARMASRALTEAGSKHRVIGVSRFTQSHHLKELEAAYIRTVPCDLLDRNAVRNLPDAPNVIFMAGMKFGSTGAEALTWAMNAYVPALVAERYAGSRIVVFSSGNIYPFVPVVQGGATEETRPRPIGEYAESVLARERLFEHFSRENETPCVILRLNYAIDLRYGVLLDLAQKVAQGNPVDLSMGNVNVIWQGDANAYALRSLAHAQSPPLILNIAGPETVSVRWIAQRFGELLDREPVFQGQESETALLNHAGKAHGLFGYPTVPLEMMIQWTADWVGTDRPTLDKPTHFETRDGRF